MLGEHERFLVFFDRMVRFSDESYARCMDARSRKVHGSLEGISYGERISSINPTSLYVHMTVVEYHWTNAIRNAAEGEVVPVAHDPALSERLSEGDVPANVKEYNRKTLEHLAELPSSHLEKSVFFVGRHYTVMGFLWGFLAHRAYHVGNLDLLMRLHGIHPPDFFDFAPQQMA